jgi:23S rRNA (guanosine2251-2'-O)-methyltransferase
MEVLKSAGCWVVGAVTTSGVPPWEVDWRGPTVLVLGGEERGLRPLVARSCDGLTHIPHAGRIGSLNVGAAGAALLYEACRQRRLPGRESS